MKNIILFIALFCASSTYAQVVPSEDSTYSAIAYWSKTDTMIYDVEFKKYKVDKGDTTVQLYTTYSIEISVLDSTEKSYVIRAKYLMDSVFAEQELIADITKSMGDISVDILTSDVGSVESVKNWQEISRFQLGALDKFKKKYEEFKSDNFDQFINSFTQLFSTQKSVENTSILDIQQMLYYQGLEYKLGKALDTEFERESAYSANLIKIEGQVLFDTLFVEDGMVRLLMSEEADPVQLKKEVISFLQKSANIDTKELEPVELSSTTYNTTYIDIYTGWVVNSFEDKQVNFGDVQNNQMRSIRLR